VSKAVKPGKAVRLDLAADEPLSLPDIITPGLSVLFSGINPGLHAATTGRHFAGRSNRFWQTLHLAGFTPERLRPEDDMRLLDYGCGLTTVVARPTVTAAEVSLAELRAGVRAFNLKVAQYRPRHVAFLSKVAYGAVLNCKDVQWGRQPTKLYGATIWVLPNPSGLNRRFRLEDLVRAYSELCVACR